DDGGQDAGLEDGRRGAGIEVAVNQDQVGIVAGQELAFVLLGELSVGGALGIGVKGLAAGDLVLRIVGFGSGFVHAGDCCVEAAEGCDRFHGIVGAEGQRNACIQEGFPCVGIGGALRSEAAFGPVHVGQQMVRLHGGYYTQLLEAGNVGGID